MRFEYVQKIVERIKRDILCPKCGEPCNKSHVDLCAIENDTVSFEMNCSKCKANMKIMAELNVQKDTVETFSRPRPLENKLRTQKIHSLKNVLGSFKGDIKDLFSS